jgi:hypothetical protein
MYHVCELCWNRIQAFRNVTLCCWVSGLLRICPSWCLQLRQPSGPAFGQLDCLITIIFHKIRNHLPINSVTSQKTWILSNTVRTSNHIMLKLHQPCKFWGFVDSCSLMVLFLFVSPCTGGLFWHLVGTYCMHLQGDFHSGRCSPFHNCVWPQFPHFLLHSDTFSLLLSLNHLLEQNQVTLKTEAPHSFETLG